MSTVIWIATAIVCAAWALFVAHEIRHLAQAPQKEQP